MTLGVGGSNAHEQLEQLVNMTDGVKAISLAEFESRLVQARGLLANTGLDAIYLNAGTNLYDALMLALDLPGVDRYTLVSQ